MTPALDLGSLLMGWGYLTGPIYSGVQHHVDDKISNLVVLLIDTMTRISISAPDIKLPTEPSSSVFVALPSNVVGLERGGRPCHQE